ncbi:MAG: T9SS type A sorting domain-containing protein [Bacteroidetes bacterium]|nr:T9SS type A sorting domain-containing protein [Bacteroidota bacterium]
MKTTFYILCFGLTFLFCNLSSAQTLWGWQYGTTDTIEDAKGHYNSTDDRYIVTGHVSNSFDLNFAYLLETNQSGAITWQTYIGDSSYNWYGASTKHVSGNKYVVVGKTDKDQFYRGAYDTSCQLMTPYYNAFIALIDPSDSTGRSNWYHVWGDSNLHDEALEVIEDQMGDFVVVGTAKGKLASFRDSCNNSDSLYTSSSSKDVAGIMVTKFSSSGMLQFNRVIFPLMSGAKYDQGVSIVEDPAAAGYRVLFKRRLADKSNPTFPAIVNVDMTGNANMLKEYHTTDTTDRIPTELILFQNNIVVVGHAYDSANQPYTSFMLNIDQMLNLLTYNEISHSFSQLLDQDVLVDNDTLVISGTLLEQVRPYSKSMFLYKAVPSTSVMNAFDLVSLYRTNYLSVMHMFYEESNTNFCLYPYTDSFSNTYNGYHLFGNHDTTIVHHKADHNTFSTCQYFYPIGIDTVYAYDADDMPNIAELDTMSTFGPVDPNIYEISVCDTTVLDTMMGDTLMAMPMSLPTISVLASRIFPNPTSGSVNITFSNPVQGTIQVYNLQGVLLKQYDINSSVNNHTVDVSNLLNGTYLMTFQGADQVLPLGRIVILK